MERLLSLENDQAYSLEIAIISISITFFAIYFLVSYYFANRRMLKAIADLQQGINVIGSGNLNNSIKSETNDEIGDLSNSVNHMAIHLKEATAKLQEQERLAAIGQTAGMVGHDIRNPLQAIVSELYLEKESVADLQDSKIKQDTLESIDFIQEQIDYINKIVADLQDYARQTKPTMSEVDLTKLVSDTFASISIPSNIQPLFYIQPSLKIITDHDFLRRIITNLSTNAIQAMPNGGKLTIDARKIQRAIKITVEDTGQGIPDDVRDKVFKPLFTTKSKGQGFGLAVVKKFVEQLGGTITFQTKTGKGTKFIIELPIDDLS